MSIVWLKHIPHGVMKENVRRSGLIQENPELSSRIDAAIYVHISRGLRFNTRTNVLQDDRIGEIQRPAKKEDIRPEISEECIIFEYFRTRILNSLSREMRGYEM